MANTPGLDTNIGNITFGGANPATLNIPTSVGTTVKSPASNVAPPSNIPPANQIAPKDISGTYARTADGTIYNKQSGTTFAQPGDFFKDSGLTSFNNLKFDTNYTPTGKETIYGTSNLANPNTTPQSSSTPTPTPQPTPTTTPNPVTGNPNTVVPNTGNNGVSQGGVIGGLINNAQNNPNLVAATETLRQDQQALAQANANIESRPEGMSEQGGDQGILNRLWASKIAADQTAIQNAISGQANTTSGLSAAATANAPIVTTPGAAIVSPSVPGTTGQTTGGAGNVASMIGTRLGADGKTTEYYNTTAPGQPGFATPQALADFINQQQPGAGATAANVFQMLSSGALNGGGTNIVGSNGAGGNSGLNPIGQVDTIAQQVLNGQIDPSKAPGMGGSVANWSTLLNQALIKANGGTAPDISALQAKYDSNQTTKTNQGNLIAQWTSAKQQSQALTGQLQPLLGQINPTNLTFANGVIQTVQGFVGNPTYQQAANLMTEIANTYAQVLTPSNGTVTDTVRNTATGMINALASGQSIAQVISGLDAQASAKINAAATASTTGGGTNSNSASIPEGTLKF